MSYRYSTPVGVLQKVIDSRHFAELMAAERVPPRWVQMICWQLAALCAITVNAHRDPKKSSAARPRDFLPWDPPAQSPEEMASALMGLTLMRGGTIDDEPVEED